MNKNQGAKHKGRVFCRGISGAEMGYDVSE